MMEPPPLPVAPLGYENPASEFGSKPLVRACILVAALHAMIQIVGVASQYLMYFASVRSAATAMNIFVGMGSEAMVGLAALVVLVAVAIAMSFARGGDAWLMWGEIILAAAMLVRDGARMYGVLMQVSRMASLGSMWRLSFIVNSLLGYAAALLIPALVIWLTRRLETRQLFDRS